MRYLRPNLLLMASVLLAHAILFSPSSQSTAFGVPMNTFSFNIDQNLITLDNAANIANLKAAIADGATGLEDSLAMAENSNIPMAVMCMPYTSILAMRETPGMMLSNGADSALNIVGMEIVLGDASNQFMQFGGGEYYQESYAPGEYTYVDMNTYQYWRVDPDLVSTSAVVQDNGTRFAMSFGNGGIKPGRATTLKVKSSTGMSLEEFFDDLTTLNISYYDPVEDEVYETGPQLLKDIDQFNDGLVNQVMTGTKNGRHFSEMVDPYGFGGTIIPEPASLALALCGFSCMALRRRRVTRVV